MNKEKLFVFGKFKSGFGMELEEVHLKRGEVYLKLSKDDWEEIQKTLDGSREKVASQEFVGFYPKEGFVWNG